MNQGLNKLLISGVIQPRMYTPTIGLMTIPSTNVGFDGYILYTLICPGLLSNDLQVLEDVAR